MNLVWRLLRFQPQYYLLLIAVNLSFYSVRLAFGLILRAFFNALPYSTSASAYLWTLIGALVAVALGRAGFALFRVRVSQTWMFSQPRFVHRNLLRRLLELPDALDVETEQTLWERLFATQNRTYLVVSHRQTVLLNGENRLRRQSLWRSNARGML
jgi:ABC-type multidrug transport system fused ATPase/permease subunit